MCVLDRLLRASGVAGAEPPRPSAFAIDAKDAAAGGGTNAGAAALPDPDFVSLPGVTHAWRGRRPNGLEGAIVHYDAGRTRPVGRPDDPEWGARNTLAGAQAQGFAFATISRTGRIYLPANMDWEAWGYHAGESRCPATGRTSVSRFYVGFELNSPGLLYPTGDADLFIPWFEAARDGQGNPLLDAQGRARPAKAGGESWRRAEVRLVPAKTGNIKPGAYAPCTPAQQAALTGVLLWLKARYPNSFRLDRVFGHDEVAPTRKADPGASLGEGDAAMTMAAFRERLKDL